MRMTRVFQMLAVLAVAVLAAAVGAAPSSASPAEGQWSSGRQLLFYNHAYGVLDRETADAIEHSDYLPDFASFQVRTTTGSQGSWTARYLYGRETYIEFFGVGDLPGGTDAFGEAGMGISVERAGDLATVTDRLKDLGIDAIPFHQTRDFGDGVPVPWFEAIFTTDVGDTFGAWGMEYRPEYFADPRSNTEPASSPGDVGRERYLPDTYRDRLMRDITGVRLGVTERDLSNTVPLLRAGGFAVRSVPTGIIAVRGGTTLQFDSVPLNQVGLKRVDFSLNRSTGTRHVETLGNSTLVVGPGIRAVWTFGAAE